MVCAPGSFRKEKKLIESRKNSLMRWLVWLVEGVAVGFGAILPGVSGGTLCAAFGVYRPLIETISSPKKNLKKHWLMLAFFIAGAGIGFVGLSGLAGMLLERNAPLITCVFIGFILGTIPQLWRDAGEKGRSTGSYAAAIVSFLVMMCILTLLKTQSSLTIAPGIPGYLLCGVLWALSFIVPGLSSSSLLLFFGLYQPMLEGISKFQLDVLVPMAMGLVLCVLLLAKGIQKAFDVRFSLISHGVLGVVAATMVMILPPELFSADGVLMCVLCIIGGGVVSFGFTKLCDRLNDSLGAGK